MAKEEPIMNEYQKAYIELIAKRVADEVKERLVEKIEYNSKRIRKIEQKVFNGFGAKITILFGLYTVIIALLVKLAFF
ncbi:MAG: hypothetical protein ACTSR2_01315 [Candidatus Hodarchaeales archaeon]